MNTNVLTKPAIDTEVVSTWQLDPAHSHIFFSVRHMMISNVRGEFQKFSGTVRLNKNDISKSYVETTIETASIQTNDANRDQHLKTADFFDVEKYPEIAFKSKSFEPRGEDEFKVIGDLTIHGVTREVALTVEGPTEEIRDPWGGTRIGLTAKTKIKRKDFDLTWNVALEAGGFLVGDDITITIEAELVKVTDASKN